MSDAELDYLTHVDHHAQEALVAFDLAGGEAIAVTRWVRTAPKRRSLRSSWPTPGSESGLDDSCSVSCSSAREEGITRFVAPVLAENAAVALLKDIGGTTGSTSGPGLALVIELPAERPLEKLLRAVADGTVVPASRLWDRVTAQRGSRSSPAPPRLLLTSRRRRHPPHG